ncbi:MAG: hypothetical protein AB7F86_17570 [Bdellovibrionales bacterium]
MYWLIFVVFAQGVWAQGGRSTIPDVREQPARSDERRPHLGVMAGIAAPEKSYRNEFEYGVDVGYQPWIPFSVGLEASAFKSRRAFGIQEQDLDRTQIFVKGSFNFGGNLPVIKDSYLGLGLGPVFDQNSPWSGTHMGIAPVAGFDIPLTRDLHDFFSLGAMAKYVFVSGPSPDTFAVNGLVKYWF